MATDITMHNDSELADWFDNDEFLYGEARCARAFDIVEQLAEELFIFTPEQMDVFCEDWKSGRYDD